MEGYDFQPRKKGGVTAAMAVLAGILACNGSDTQDKQEGDPTRVAVIEIEVKDFIKRRLTLCRAQLRRTVPGTFLADAEPGRFSSVSPDARIEDVVAAVQECDARLSMAIGAMTQGVLDRFCEEKVE